jgi:hypothetical protein
MDDLEILCKKCLEHFNSQVDSHPHFLVKSTGRFQKVIKKQKPKQIRRHKKKFKYHRNTSGILHFIPSFEMSQDLILSQRTSLLKALSDKNRYFSDELQYPFSRVQPLQEGIDTKVKKLNPQELEVIRKFKMQTAEGVYGPLIILEDPNKGYIVKTTSVIKRNCLIGFYSGDVDSYNFKHNSSHDDSLLTLHYSDGVGDKYHFRHLVISSLVRGNITRYLSGINNIKPEEKLKINIRADVVNVDGFLNVMFRTTRNIACHEELYWDYNQGAFSDDFLRYDTSSHI